MSTDDHLIYMANQIARNFAATGTDAAIAATADHIKAFWDPRMKQRLFAHYANGGEGLDAIATSAVERLRSAPTHDR